MKALPTGLVSDSQTPEFTAQTVPPGLLRRHTTKAGVWAKIIVLEGALTYRILEPELEEMVLTPGHDGIIAPEVPHEVVPHEGVRFHVAFYMVQEIGEAR